LADSFYFCPMIEIGKILKTKGFDGTTIVEFYYPIVQGEFKAFFIGKNSQYTPLLILKSQPIDEHTFHILWLRHESKELAVNLNNCELYMEEEIAEAHFDLEALEDFMGYQVYNFDNLLGIVSGLYENNLQETIEVEMNNGKKLLIPLIDEMISTIDDENESIYVELDDEFIRTFSN
jgi:ribosomal 30S subunit maturation factor RimM